MVAVVGQAIQDAMGLYGSDKERVYIPNERGVRGKRNYTTEQQIAIDWFIAGEHSKYCEVVEIEPSWINHLLKTKAGVKL